MIIDTRHKVRFRRKESGNQYKLRGSSKLQYFIYTSPMTVSVP